jgi:hypothetical protein
MYSAGYILIAFLQRGPMVPHRWRTRPQPVDAVAVVAPVAIFLAGALLGAPAG